MLRRLAAACAVLLLTGGAVLAQDAWPGMIDRIQSLPPTTPTGLTDLIASEYDAASTKAGTPAGEESAKRVERLVAAAEGRAEAETSPRERAALAEAQATANVNAMVTEIPNEFVSEVDRAATATIAAEMELFESFDNEADGARAVAEMRVAEAQKSFDKAYDRWWRTENPSDERVREVQEEKEALNERRIELRNLIKGQVGELGENADWEDLPEEYRRRFKELERKAQLEHEELDKACDRRYAEWQKSYVENPVSPSLDLQIHVIRPCQAGSKDFELKYRNAFEILDGQYFSDGPRGGLPFCEDEKERERKEAEARKKAEAEAAAQGRTLPPVQPKKKKPCAPGKAPKPPEFKIPSLPGAPGGVLPGQPPKP